MSQKTFSLGEVCECTGLEPAALIVFVEREWIHPAQSDQFDEEDRARIQLIQELRRDFGVNDEAIPLLLHLMDQLYALRERVRRLGE